MCEREKGGCRWGAEGVVGLSSGVERRVDEGQIWDGIGLKRRGVQCMSVTVGTSRTQRKYTANGGSRKEPLLTTTVQIGIRCTFSQFLCFIIIVMMWLFAIY